MSFLQPVIALLQFTTIVPLGKTVPFDEFAKRCWLYPIAGYVTGGLAGMILFLLPAPPMVSAVLGIGFLLLITGCNHLDGLMDLGDGLMAHGSREVRIRALTDRTIGTGGMALGVLVTVLSITSLASAHPVWMAVIISEVFGKYVMALMTIYGKPFHEGLHAALHRQSRPLFLIPATILLFPVIFLPISGITLVLSVLLVGLIPATLLFIAGRLFGGVNGDVTGAAGEITRAGVLTVFACTAGFPIGGGLVWLVV